MSLQVVLLIGKEPEIAPALFEKLSEESLVECLYLEDFSQTQALMEDSLPDLILLFADALEAAEENVYEFCMNLREQSTIVQGEYRPVLVIQTASQDEEKRIQYLLHGADDTLSSSLSTDELGIRLLVHLRRNLDILSNTQTRLPGLKLCSKLLQRQINRHRAAMAAGVEDAADTGWALMLIELDHFDVYGEVYGELARTQVVKTFGAMLRTLVVSPDFIGHSSETDTFIVISHPDRVEKIAALLCQQFDSVVPNFYSEKDKKQGYIISVSDSKASRRVPLLSLSIGIATHIAQPVETYKAAFNACNEMRMLAQATPGNHWVSDRLKLSGSKTAVSAAIPSVLVIESDAALAFLLKTTLEMQHYQVDAVSNPSDAIEMSNGRTIDLVLMDAVLNGENTGWELCRTLKAKHPNTNVIFISTVHDRDKALSAGADLYLPKPFELVSLFSWIDRLLKGA